MFLDRGDVDARAHHEHALGRGVLARHRGGHIAEDGHRVGAVQAAAEHLDHRAVVTADNRQRGGVAVEEQQRSGGVADRAAGGLGQRAGGVQFGHQHHVGESARSQCVTQDGGLGVVGPGDADRFKMMSAGFGALLRAEHGLDHLLGRAGRCCARRGADVEYVVIDGRAVALLPFDQHHPHCRRCQGHTEYDVHLPLQSVCYIARFAATETSTQTGN
ncbi:hypothetical protein BN1047_01260 [Mycolicibacterium neoaurum]|uniref:Uncharacterized protein n=1 Tax=Mycolicibacterium neoaurum TaxID=1795 RepID=A0AAV2WGJ1_MYCNE|nr:hypothetical protein BN1047_01260 [Mycolicibacterium neoaurum]